MENIYSKITNPELYKDGLTPYPTVQSLEEWLNDEVSLVKNRSIALVVVLNIVM